MQRLFALTLFSTLTLPLASQCLSTIGGVSAGLVAVGTDPANDEGVSPPIAIGFPFPLGSGVYSHLVADSNGVLYLTNGGAAVGRVLFGAGDLGDIRGAVGDSPRVFPLWTDLEGASSWAVNVDTSVAGRCKVNWIRCREFFSVGQAPFSFSATLDATGLVEFAYGALPALPNWSNYAAVGISAGNGVGTPFDAPSDLTAFPDSGTLPLLYEELTGAVPDLANRSFTLFPNGAGGFQSVVSCEYGHRKSGAGCYGDTVYEWFPNATAASAALQGNSLVLTPAATGYTATWVPAGAASFVVPVGATALPRSDDDQHTIDLAANGLPSFPYPGGATAVLHVHSNGFVSTTGTGNDNGQWNSPHFNDYVPSPSFRNAPETAFWAWHDWEPSDVTGGAIVWHHDALQNVLYVTWDGVENHANQLLGNPGTFQFQFHLATGRVDYVWAAVDATTTSPRGSGHLVGYSPGGASADPGPLAFAVAGGTTTMDTFRAMTLDATPQPLITVGGTSNPISYSVFDMPDFAPPAGLRIGFLAFSAAPLPGVDLGFLGAPGCQLHVSNLDIVFPISAAGSSTQTLTLTYPAPLFPGLVFHAQALAFLPPNSLPGGLNALGLSSSNGLATRF